jgi:hypothetical protein
VRLTVLAVVLAAGCAFDHGVLVQLDAPALNDDSNGSMIDASTADAPTDSAAVLCSTSGFLCAGTPGFALCNGACWVKCQTSAALPNQNAADVACTAWGGKLAPIRSAADQQCVAQLLFPGQANWIGLEQSDSATTVSSGWSWNSDGAPLTFTAWATGQPNDANGNENSAEQCAYMSTSGTWQDTDCTANVYTRFSCRK